MRSAIRSRGLTRRFGKTLALDGVNLEVGVGAVYALVGENGAGKTTLIKLLMNLIRPTGGKAEVLGFESGQLSGKIFARIGYVSENQQIPEWMTVGEMLSYYRNFYPTWDRTLEERLVSQFDLPVKRKLKHLSRGMRMKASLASSLAYRPELIVLDEPFSGLDPLVRDELVEGLIERASEATVFISSHDLADIERVASHIGFLESGRLRFSEEMTTLTNRFRAVTVTLADPWNPHANRPSTWLQLEASESVVRFVDSKFDAVASVADCAAIFPNARDVIFDPMTLRSIFLTMARSARAKDSLGQPSWAVSEVQA
jgi:ABC-2 type transport system ATP-binding protein